MTPGSFNEEAQAIWDFVRCVRPDGTAYGTNGLCRKGTQEAKEIENPPEKNETPLKPRLGGELVGSTDRITGGEARKKLEGRIKYFEEVKKKYPDDVEIIDHDLNRLNKELDKFKANEKILEGVVANVPAGTKVTVTSMGYIRTEVKTNSGHNVSTTFGRKNFNFQVNEKYDAGSVTDRREQIQVANTVRRTYEALVKALPEGAVVSTAAWTEDGRGQSRMDAYVKMGFSRPKTTKNGEEVDGPPGMNQYAKKSNGKMVPSNQSEEGLDHAYNFSEESDAVALWHAAIFGVKHGISASYGEALRVPGFSKESLNVVSAMLFAEPGDIPAQPCPPKKPPGPKPPPQPPNPAQPSSVGATQQPAQVQQQQKQKKPKCIPQTQPKP